MALFSLFFLAIGRARLDRDQGWGALGGSGNPCTPAEARLAPLKGHRAWGYEKSSEEPGMTQQEPVAGHAPNPTPTPISETDDSATPVKRSILVVAAIIAIPRDPSPSPSHTVAAAARAGVAGDADPFVFWLSGSGEFLPAFRTLRRRRSTRRLPQTWDRLELWRSGPFANASVQAPVFESWQATQQSAGQPPLIS